MKTIVVNKQLPTLSMNFEEVKNSLIEATRKYEGIVVTEEGLKDCKATQRELASIRNEIDSYRKTIKKEIEKPIKEFEAQCKELIELVANTERPIKAGIEVFNDMKREEKRQIAENIIKETIPAIGLSEKYAKQLTVSIGYTNVSTSIKAIKEDIAQRAMCLKAEQDEAIAKEKITRDCMIATVEAANVHITSKLRCEDFEKYVELGWSISNIIREINQRAELVRRAEAPKVEEVKVETPKVEEIKEEPAKPIEEVEIETPTPTPPPAAKDIYVEMKITGSYEKLAKLSMYMKVNGYNYNVLSQGVIN